MKFMVASIFGFPRRREAYLLLRPLREASVEMYNRKLYFHRLGVTSQNGAVERPLLICPTKLVQMRGCFSTASSVARFNPLYNIRLPVIGCSR